jgi:hypothetical protein
MKKHIKQVAAWGKLSGLCNALGDAYRPSKESMKGTAMENLLTASQVQIAAVQNAETFLANAITERREAFDQIPVLGTRIIAALTALGASQERINDVNAIRKRFRYQALPKEVTAPQSSSSTQMEHGTADTEKSARHPITYGDFANRLNNFNQMISQLEKGTPYEPQEEDLTIDALKRFSAVLTQKHEQVAQAQLSLYQEKKKRDDLLFSTNGIYGNASMIKMYVRSVYGFKSTESKTISRVKFEK